MKKNLLLIVYCVLCFSAVAQNYSTTIKIQAMDMAKSLLKKDFTTFAKYMHPKVIEMAGGKEKLSQRMDTANAAMKQFGAEIKKILIGNPANVVTYKNELQTTLPQTTELQTGFGNAILETTIIAISTDGGKNWYFIDTSVYNVKDIKKSLPNISPDLVIPPVKPPKFVPNQQ